MRHDKFAERVERRLRGAADRLEADTRELGIDGGAARTADRAGELRVAALMVRGEAEAVSRSEETPGDPEEDKLFEGNTADLRLEDMDTVQRWVENFPAHGGDAKTART